MTTGLNVSSRTVSKPSPCRKQSFQEMYRQAWLMCSSCLLLEAGAEPCLCSCETEAVGGKECAPAGVVPGSCIKTAPHSQTYKTSPLTRSTHSPFIAYLIRFELTLFSCVFSLSQCPSLLPFRIALDQRHQWTRIASHRSRPYTSVGYCYSLWNEFTVSLQNVYVPIIYYRYVRLLICLMKQSHIHTRLSLTYINLCSFGTVFFLPILLTSLTPVSS